MPFKEANKPYDNKSINRVDIFHNEHESVEEKSSYLLEQLKNGEINIADLMGPLSNIPNLTPIVTIPPGVKVYSNSAEAAEFLPRECAHNVLLTEHICPSDYVNPNSDNEEYDLLIIGAGVSGLISCIIGSWLGIHTQTDSSL